MNSGDLFPLFAIDATKHLLELSPYSHDDWTVSDALSDERSTLHKHIEALVGLHIRSTRLRGSTTLQVTLTDGSVRMVRTLRPGEDTWRKRCFEGDHAVLKWLCTNTTVPVPEFIALDETNSIYVSSVLPGLDAFHAYPAFESISQKEASVISYATVFADAFRLLVPKRFGSAKKTSLDDGPALCAGSYLSISQQHSFDLDGNENLCEFFSLLVEGVRARVGDDDKDGSISRRLTRLLDGLQPHIEQVSRHDYMTRFTLLHQDLRPENVLLDPQSGKVTGLIDWEFHAFVPTVLATNYPSWILYSGRSDPKYCNPKSPFETWWLEAPVESARLRTLFEEAVRVLDEEYYQCLINPSGRLLRDGFDWLTHNKIHIDPGYEGMGAWIESELFGVSCTRSAESCVQAPSC